MMRTWAVLVILVLSAVTSASAQEAAPVPPVTLLPSDAPKRDVAGLFAWFDERRSNPSFGSNRSVDAVSGGITVGYYWTPHLKTGIDLAVSTEGETYSIEPIAVAGSAVPVYLPREHRLRTAVLAAGVSHQFFENRWFHPFVGTGLELLREREQIETVFPFAPGTRPSFVMPEGTERRLRYTVRPFVETGFKVYFSEHAFIRSDIRTSWTTDGLASLAWRSGVGVDF